jgi:hypothetical protein
MTAKAFALEEPGQSTFTGRRVLPEALLDIPHLHKSPVDITNVLRNLL